MCNNKLVYRLKYETVLLEYLNCLCIHFTKNYNHQASTLYHINNFDNKIGGSMLDLPSIIDLIRIFDFIGKSSL